MAIGISNRIITVYDGPVSVKELVEDHHILIYGWNPHTKLPEICTIDDFIPININSFNVSFDSGLVARVSGLQRMILFRGTEVYINQLTIGASVRAFSMSLHRDGHYRVHGWVDGKAKHQYSARMVWEYFNGKIPDDMVLHHVDLNKTNNRLENFKLMSRADHTSLHSSSGTARRAKNHKVIDISVAEDSELMYMPVIDRSGNFIVADDTPIAGCTSGVVMHGYSLD